jgi:hypothetical protein
MAAFLMLDASQPNGAFHRKIAVNVDSISRIEPSGPNCCILVMREHPSENIYVAGSLKDVFDQILEHSLPPNRAPGR